MKKAIFLSLVFLVGCTIQSTVVVHRSDKLLKFKNFRSFWVEKLKVFTTDDWELDYKRRHQEEVGRYFKNRLEKELLTNDFKVEPGPGALHLHVFIDDSYKWGVGFSLMDVKLHIYDPRAAEQPILTLEDSQISNWREAAYQIRSDKIIRRMIKALKEQLSHQWSPRNGDF